MPTHLEIVARLKQQSALSDLGNASTSELNEYAAAICSPNAFGEFGDRQFPQICETVRIHLLRAHIAELQKHVTKLHDHITTLNKSNSRLQCAVLVLTVMSVIGTGAQVWYAANPSQISGSKQISIEMPPQLPATQSVFPTLLASPSSGQATKK